MNFEEGHLVTIHHGFDEQFTAVNRLALYGFHSDLGYVGAPVEQHL
jgi:hypothetical protein